MKVVVIALLSVVLCLISPDSSSSQDPKADPVPPALSARMEVDAHEHCFTVRFFLKNAGKRNIEVIQGRGGRGLETVPQFHLGSLTITPPTYLRPPRRSLRSDTRQIPAGSEILYGTFTLGYPPLDLLRDEKLFASIDFAELKTSLQTEPQPLKVSAPK